MTITEATTAGGRSRAQASAQLARAGRKATGDLVLSFAISAESEDIPADLAAYLACSPAADGLAGAELVSGAGWFGLRSHPRPIGSISFGGPSVPNVVRRHTPRGGAASVISKPARIVDAHVHLWDPARVDWYPYLSTSGAELNMGDVSGMSRRFDVPTYLSESAGWNVEKLVNVAAATGRHSIDETLELDRRADADTHPDAIIGGLPPTDSVAEAVAALDEQMAAPRFRGVRPMGVP